MDDSNENSSVAEGPVLEVDLKMYTVYAEGGEGDSLEDVQAVVDEEMDRAEKSLEKVMEMNRETIEQIEPSGGSQTTSISGLGNHGPGVQ